MTEILLTLERLLNLTGSDNDHEALSASRTANKLLKKVKLTWAHALNITPKPMSRKSSMVTPIDRKKELLQVLFDRAKRNQDSFAMATIEKLMEDL